MYRFFILCFLLLLSACHTIDSIDARTCLDLADKASYMGSRPDSLYALCMINYVEVPGQKIEGEICLEIKFPSQMKVNSIIANIDQSVMVVKDSSYTQVSKLAGYKNFSDSEKQQILFEMKRMNPQNDFVSLFDRIEFADLILPHESCYVIDAYPNKTLFHAMKKQRYFIRKSDFKLVREEGLVCQEETYIPQVIVYEQFENISGMSVPKKTIVIQENQRNEMKLYSLEINPILTDSHFNIPQDNFKE